MRPKGSPGLIAFCLLTHLLAALAVLLVRVAPGVRLALLAAIVVSLRRALRPPAVRGLRFAEGAWWLDAGEGYVEARLESWFAHPWLCVVTLREACAGRRRRLVLPADAVSRDGHRRLRTALRLSRPEPGPDRPGRYNPIP